MVSKKLHHSTLRTFRSQVYKHFSRSARILPWRGFDPFPAPWDVVVSEIMLQQTQVDRVCGKFLEFKEAFPDVYALKEAPVETLLRVWKGLGYNRRALNLQRAAKIIVEEHGGKVPEEREALEALPGIGPATARSVRVYAFNKPEAFIETNVRAVYIHHFFPDEEKVHDSELFPLVEQTLDTEEPAKWYSALMDYGTELKKKMPNPSRRSAHHTRQSRFEGSNRQLRSRMLSVIMEAGTLTIPKLATHLDADEDAVRKNSVDLCREGFLEKRGSWYRIRA